jgi:uncharacterized protein (DUF433 family)
MNSFDASLIGTGLYPLRQAARLVGEEARTVRRWLKGYSWKYKDGRSSSGPLWHLQFEGDEELGEERVLGFRDLLELRTVARFVEQGVSLRVIRETIVAAREYLGDYPLQSRRFLTDGKRIFLEAVERAGGDPRLLDVRRRQFVFNSVIRPSLFEGIDYNDDGQALRWFPMPRQRLIVLDPQVQFGEPVVADAGVPTDILHAAYLAEGKDRAQVSRLFCVTPRAVSAAVDFEQRLAA